MSTESSGGGAGVETVSQTEEAGHWSEERLSRRTSFCRYMMGVYIHVSC